MASMATRFVGVLCLLLLYSVGFSILWVRTTPHASPQPVSSGAASASVRLLHPSQQHGTFATASPPAPPSPELRQLKELLANTQQQLAALQTRQQQEAPRIQVPQQQQQLHHLQASVQAVNSTLAQLRGQLEQHVARHTEGGGSVALPAPVVGASTNALGRPKNAGDALSSSLGSRPATVEQVSSLRQQLRLTERRLVEVEEKLAALRSMVEAASGATPGQLATLESDTFDRTPWGPQWRPQHDPPPSTMVPDDASAKCTVPRVLYHDTWPHPLAACKPVSGRDTIPFQLRYTVKDTSAATAELAVSCDGVDGMVATKRLKPQLPKVSAFRNTGGASKASSLAWQPMPHGTKLQFGGAKASVEEQQQGYIAARCHMDEPMSYLVTPQYNHSAYLKALQRNKEEHASNGGDAAKRRPNVAVLMVDALSRAHFYRALPKTLRALTNMSVSDHYVYDFKRYSIMGAYSPPNRYAVFSGYPPFFADVHYQGSPFPKNDTSINVSKRRHEGNWMWEYMSQLGYMTFSTRDMCSKMADHVYDAYVSRPWTDVHFQDLFCDILDFTAATSFVRCIGDKHAHDYSLDAASLFHTTYAKVPKLTIVDLIEAHEPTMRMARALDDRLAEWIPEIMSDGNTAMVIVSDHGIGDFAKLESVHLEERLPALFMAAPRSLVRALDAHHHLQANTLKLVTPLDVFETVVNLGRSQPTTSPVRPWAHSVFTQLPDRSCKEAGIGISSCACDMWDEDTFIASTRKWE